MIGDPLREAIALHDRFTHVGMDRRAFMAELTRPAGGSAAAALLLSSIAADAQAVPQVAADDPRLTTRELEWEARPGRHYRGYHAAPREGRNLPVIFVIHENRGLNEHIRDVTRRAARRLFGGRARLAKPGGRDPGRRRGPRAHDDRRARHGGDGCGWSSDDPLERLARGRRAPGRDRGLLLGGSNG